MPTMVVIGGVSVDQDDPCELYRALYAVKLKMLGDVRVEETEFRSPVTQRRVKVAAASIKDIDDELVRLAQACQIKQTGRRYRYAKRMRFI